MPGGNETKILALTASAFEEDRRKVLAAGCDDFVRKINCWVAIMIDWLKIK